MTLTVDIPLDVLHPDLAVIADRCGVGAARAVVAEYGGARIWIPRQWRDGPPRPLERLDEDLARQICAALGGDVVAVPLRLFTPKGMRCMIRRMAASGATAREISRALRCSYWTIHNELRGAGIKPSARVRDDRQIDLFEGL